MSGAANQTGDASKEYLGMSDEDFLNINSPTTAAAPVSDDEGKDQGATPGSATPEADTGEDATDETKNLETNKSEDTDAATDASGDSADTSGDSEPVVNKSAEAKSKTDPTDANGKESDKAAESTGSKPKADGVEGADKKDDEAAVEAKPVDHASFYKQIMTPFKANGRTIELKTPEEAIRLMQMGAGYGRKIQDLQPHLKVLRMLEKNDLLDEGRLSFLIDVNQKNPDAIKKIIKDSGIDPLDLNMEDNVSYQPKSHAVSDKEMAFQEALTDIQSHANGQETLKTINQTWDQESKSALWDQPQLLSVIQSQRDNGFYDQIVAEIDRQKLLGQIPQTTSFLQAYKVAGDHLQATQGFKVSAGQAPQIQTQPGDTPQTQVIATRAAAPKAQVQNGDKAAAASAPKTDNSRKGGAKVNPLEMADDVFMKQFEGRLG